MDYSKKKATKTYKVVMIGDTGVGKTRIAHRFIGKYTPYDTPTIGAAFFHRELVTESRKYRLQIWDTTGQEAFRSLVPIYYRGADLAIVVYSIDSIESYRLAEEWGIEINQYVPICLLVGNKTDLEDRRIVTKKMGQDLAERLRVNESRGNNTEIKWFEISAKDDLWFDYLLTETIPVIESHESVTENRKINGSVRFNGSGRYSGSYPIETMSLNGLSDRVHGSEYWYRKPNGKCCG